MNTREKAILRAAKARGMKVTNDAWLEVKLRWLKKAQADLQRGLTGPAYTSDNLQRAAQTIFRTGQRAFQDEPEVGLLVMTAARHVEQASREKFKGPLMREAVTAMQRAVLANR